MYVVLYPHLAPESDTGAGKSVPLICVKCECQAEGFLRFGIDKPDDNKYADCPSHCDGYMEFHWGGVNLTVKSSGPGVSSTKYGMKRARELTKRNEKLKETQWEQHEPITVPEGRKVRNPTRGGPLDPNSRFNKKTKR